MVWQHIVHDVLMHDMLPQPFKCFNVCFRIIQDILVPLLVFDNL
jgi:hypothetical protein